MIWRRRRPHSLPYKDGWRAFHCDKGAEANPYDPALQPASRDEWYLGWHASKMAAERARYSEPDC